ncbi:MAG: prohibitin family protein [Candidatus Sericytochromatia bacterium]
MAKLKLFNLYAFIGVIVVAIFFVFDSTIYIQPGHVGVFINKISGKISEEPIHSGYQIKLPFFHQIIEYPYHMQTILLTRDITEGSPTNEEININSIEGQPVSCDVSLSFTLKPEKVPFLYTSFRQSIDSITHGFVKQTIRQSMQEIIGKTSISDFLGKNKADAVQKIEEDLKIRLSQYGFEVKQFTINWIRPPQAVIEAISQKNIMEQEALKAQNELVKFQYEAQQKAEKAKGKAKAILIEAEAQAKANKILSNSISETLVKYKSIEKWDGLLPTVSTGKGNNTSTMLNLKLPNREEDNSKNEKSSK